MTRPSEMKIIRAAADNKKFNPGRRSFIKYRDLGVEEATGGDVRAEVMHIDGTGQSRPTGWHYHTADLQINFLVKGWVKMEFDGLGVVTLEEGDCITIPGGTIHQELCSSDAVELLEISVPAKLQTVNVDAPAWAQESAEHYGEVSGPQAVGHSA